MKFLFINGSPRKNGSTATILKSIEAGLPSESSIEWVDINDLSMQPCTGCLKCRPDKDCVLKEDDAHRIVKKLKETDVLIIGSPTYWGNMTGTLKILFDRSVTVLRQIAAKNKEAQQLNQPIKTAVIVTTSNSPWPMNMKITQSAGAIRSIKSILHYGGYKIVGTINYANAATKGTVSQKVINNAIKLGKKLRG